MILAIIDIDTNRERGQAENMMVVNNSERSRIAREYADHFSGREQTSAFFAKMFDPDLVKHDVIEPGAREQIERIELRAKVVYLTSRPHTMREATLQWLEEQGVIRPCTFKNYGTGEKDESGKYDNGDRYIKTAVWKAREVERIIQEAEAQDDKVEWVLFVDDEEANRQAVAEIGDPRILIRCSLADTLESDFKRYKLDDEMPPFLKRLMELANILEKRESFVRAEKCQLTITRPAIPGQEPEQHTSVMIESWQAAAYAPDQPELRYYRYNELYPQRNELSEVEQIISLQTCCDESGKVISTKMAKTGPALSLLNELEEVFEPGEEEKRQKYADRWKAYAIEEFGYLEVARVQRGIQITGKPAMDAYIAHLKAKNEETKSALRGGSKDE